MQADPQAMANVYYLCPKITPNVGTPLMKARKIHLAFSFQFYLIKAFGGLNFGCMIINIRQKSDLIFLNNY